MTAPHAWIGKWEQQRREREVWEAANPEVAAAWNAAWEEDERWRVVQYKKQQAIESERRFPDRLQTVGVPLRCAELVRTASETPSQIAGKAFRSSECTFLLLLGGAGAGKSVAASWVLGDVLWPDVLGNPRVDAELLRRKALFVRASEVSRVTASDYDEEAQGFLERCMRVPWLVIDDLGAERAWDGWLARLDELIDARYGDRRKTIITSNLDSKAFKERYGERIADRIRHDGTVVTAGANSLRTKRPEATP